MELKRGEAAKLYVVRHFFWQLTKATLSAHTSTHPLPAVSLSPRVKRTERISLQQEPTLGHQVRERYIDEEREREGVTAAVRGSDRPSAQGPQQPRQDKETDRQTESVFDQGY